MDPRGRVLCPKLISRDNRLQSQRRGFFDAIGNIGRLEALNEVGLGNVRRGLSALAAASNQVRSGESVVPGNSDGGIVNSILQIPIDAVEQGANAVLGAVNLGRDDIDAAAAINANVANRALGSAQQIFQNVRQGNFQISDIPGAFQELQNLETLVRGIFPGGDRTSNQNGLQRFPCLPSPYAVDLIQRAPRFKFMYIVDIKFTPAYAEYNGIASGMAFITKSSTRPQVDFEYEEVNMYNYRTQVAKRTIFQPMTMRFIDDQTGTTMRFYELYLKSMSPITTYAPTSPALPGTYEDRSMDFEQTTNVQFSERLPIGPDRLADGQDGENIIEQTERLRQNAANRANGMGQREGFDPVQQQIARGNNTNSIGSYSASLGALNANPTGECPKNLLSTITLYHIGNYGDSITAFTMLNPRITSMQPDEVMMAETGDGSELTLEFNYDAVHVTPNRPIDDFGLDRLFDISGGNAGATFPLLPIGTGERTEGGSASQGTTASVTPPPGSVSECAAPLTSSNPQLLVPSEDSSIIIEQPGTVVNSVINTPTPQPGIRRTT